MILLGCSAGSSAADRSSLIVQGCRGTRLIKSPLEFHFTPRHASWLNMVEIEIGVRVPQCLDRRIPDKARLTNEITAWERRRNPREARIKWIFTVDRARENSVDGLRSQQVGPTSPHESVKSTAAGY